MSHPEDPGSAPVASASDGFRCGRCGDWHPDVPLDFHAGAPVRWAAEMDGQPHCELTSDLCVIEDSEFFLRGLIRLPIVGRVEHFVWGVWTTLSRESFERVIDDWERPGREDSPPMFGWLATALPTYAVPTVGLKTMVHTQPVGSRPLLELEPTDHPLAVDQREGLSWPAVLERVEGLLHRDPPRGVGRRTRQVP